MVCGASQGASAAEGGKAMGSQNLDILYLVFLGVGNTLGAGVYVLTGAVARDTSGPAIVLSFLIAALASWLAALCYLEFRANVPEGNTDFVYTYQRLGKLWAFIRGWSAILCYASGVSSVARALSETIDGMIGGLIHTFFKDNMSMNALGYLAEYPDLFAVGMILVLMIILLGSGVEENKWYYMVYGLFTLINVVMLFLVIIIGFSNGNEKNWHLDPNEILENDGSLPPEDILGKGGFAPFGVSGVLSGGATCLYAFTGFDFIISSIRSKAKPQKTVCAAISVTLIICTLAYILVPAALTLMMPYYKLGVSNALPVAFKYVGLEGFNNVVPFGFLSALLSSLLGSMFQLPTVIYKMAGDGLLFPCLRRNNKKCLCTLVAGFMSALMASLFSLRDLVDLMASSTLLVYTMKAASVLVLSYWPTEDQQMTTDKENCKVHLMPYLAILSAFLNTFLMLWFNKGTMARLIIWSFLGFFIYIVYGRHWRSCQAPMSVPTTECDQDEETKV